MIGHLLTVQLASLRKQWRIALVGTDERERQMYVRVDGRRRSRTETYGDIFPRDPMRASLFSRDPSPSLEIDERKAPPRED